MFLMEATASSSAPDYVIETAQGAIPYIVNTNKPYLNKPRLVYLDDFLYKDSFYDKGGVLGLRDFVASDTEVYLATRGKPSVLNSKRGNFKLTKESYDEISERMGITIRPDYKTGTVMAYGRELLQPSDLDEFNKFIDEGASLFSTKFVNSLTESGMILAIRNDVLCAESILDSDNEYVKYMYSIKEINSFTFMSELNYRVLHEYFEILKIKRVKN